MTDKRVRPLPPSSDEIWDGAEKYLDTPVRLHICESHTNFITHDGYMDNGDGTASCTRCSWGFRLPGYLRILDGKVFDLRKASKSYSGQKPA